MRKLLYLRMKYFIVLLIILFVDYSYSNSKTLDSLTTVVNISTDTVKANALLNIGKYYKTKQEYLFAINYYKQALDYFLENSKRKASIYNEIGIMYYLIGDNSSSLSNQFKSLNIANLLDANDLKVDIYNNIGMAYCNAKKYDEAIKFYNNSLSIIENKKDTSKIIYLKSNIAIIYNYKEEYQKALDYYEEIISNYQDYKFFSEYNVPINNNIGLIYYNLGDYVKSEQYYNKALKYSENQKIGLINIYNNLGELFLKQENFNKAYNYFNNSIDLCYELDNDKVLLDNYNNLTKIFISTAKTDSALKYYNLHNSLRDSIFDKKYINKIAELETSYNFKLKENEIKKLNTEKQLNEEKYNRYIISLILVIILLIVFTLYIYLRKKGLKTDKFIVKQNLKLVKYEEQIDNVENSGNAEIQDNDKYKTSALTEELKTKLELSISSKFRKEKLYLKNDLSVTDLANMFNTNRNNISQVINERFDKNFNNLVNEYRINEAIRLLSKPENRKFTIDAISKKVGFNSISVFNTAFKKVAGVTPSTFIKSVSNE